MLAVGAVIAPIVSHGLSFSARGRAPVTSSLCYARQSVLNAGDFTYLGAIRMPQSGTDTSYAYGSVTGRIVNGKVHLFISGNHLGNDPIYEIEDPGSGYTKNYTQAPRARLVTAWGDIFHGKRTSWDAGGAPLTLQYVYPDSFYWNESTQLLYWTYNDSYNVTGRPDWGLGASSLDDPSTARSTAYGPWRTTVTDGDGKTFYGPWRCSYLFASPSDGSMMCGAPIQSGDVNSPWGPDAYGGHAWPTRTTPAGNGNPDLRLPDRYLEYYFMGDQTSANYVDENGAVHGRLRSFRRTTELPAWDYYPGTLPVRANPASNNGVGSWSELDGTGGAIWLELNNKRGVVFTADLVGAVSQDPNDCVNTAHEWYANEGLGHARCPHGCAAPVSITGPVTTASFSAFIIYNPDDLLAVKTGSKTDYTVDPARVIDLTRTYGIHRAPVTVLGAGTGGFYFDPVRKYLYLVSTQADDSRAGSGYLESLIHVFAINDGS